MFLVTLLKKSFKLLLGHLVQFLQMLLKNPCARDAEMLQGPVKLYTYPVFLSFSRYSGP